MSLDLLKKSLLTSPIIQKEGYSYLIHPLLDGISEVDPLLLSEVIERLKKQMKPFLPVDKIVTIEAMGIPYASILSLELQVPFTIIRKKSYGFEDEVKITQHTGYAKNHLFINGIRKGESIIIIDDVISTGGTIKSVLQQLQQMKVNVKAVFLLVDKGNCLKKMQKEMNIPIEALVTITIEQKTVTIVD